MAYLHRRTVGWEPGTLLPVPPEWLSAAAGGVGSLLGTITGASSGSTYVITRWIFLRAIGVVTLIAFASLWVQVRGLIGSNGILPAQGFLDAVRDSVGGSRFLAFPTIFWFTGASDAVLSLACLMGVVASLHLIVGIAPLAASIVLFVLYLSLFVVGQDFLSFQWDTLLLEVLFLALLFAPASLAPGVARETPLSLLALLLLWWLIFRFHVESGVVKLSAGDPTWWNLTALNYHYFTTPLPTWTGWFMHQLPPSFHKLSVLFTYAVEIVVPILIFTVRPLRLFAAGAFVLLQLIIMATGNYNFFNLLTIAISLTLLDDAAWRWLVPSTLLPTAPLTLAGAIPLPFSVAIVAFAVVALLVGSAQLARSIKPRTRVPLIRQVEAVLSPFGVINSYGLFRVMTLKRPEIVVEGSDDGATWHAYAFRWKPGDLAGRPRFVEPHQPRLDWQMWFAALSSYQRTPWVRNFLVRLLQGSPEVVALLRHNPFPSAPPRYVRTLLYDYEFTTPQERRSTGQWWKRTLLGTYSPVLSLQ